MNVLVVNCGSSSLKYQLIDMEHEVVLAKGQFEKIGSDDAIFTHRRPDADKLERIEPVADHKVALQVLLDILVDPEHGVIGSMDEIDAVGHRVVHGAEKFADSVLITPAVMEALEECAKIAPLHNPPNIQGIEACQKIMPNVPQVGVFDTAFHQTMPAEAFLYGLPYEAYTDLGVRRYGFHGTSHRYVSHRVCEMLGVDIKTQKIITCHIGNGASMAAIKNGKVIDTSMGLTPLAGLMMGSRSGDIDPSAVTYLMDKLGKNPQEMADFLNKESGVLGITGISSDMRDIENADLEGNELAHLALQMYAYRIKKYIGAYAAAMNGVDIIVWTAGVGENQTGLRWDVCEDMEFFGIKLDKERNKARGVEQILSTDDSKVKVVLVPTDEEIVIARDTQDLVRELKK